MKIILTLLIIVFSILSNDSFGQDFKKEFITGDYSEISDTSIKHIITTSNWIIKNDSIKQVYNWESKFEIIKQPNNQPNLFQEYLVLKNEINTFKLDLVNYWSDTLILYNLKTKNSLRLKKSQIEHSTKGH